MTEFTKKQILDREDDPQALEDLYWSDPENFKVFLKSAANQRPKSKLFKFWRVRLEYVAGDKNHSAVPIAVVCLLAVFFGLMVRVPENFFSEIWYYPRFAPFFTILSVSTYFLFKNPNHQFSIALSTFSILTSIYLILIPDWQTSDSVTMALIHLPLTTLIFMGICFVQKAWRETEQRVAFIKFCGDLFILSILILLGGGVLTAFTMGLFELMDLNIEEWYISNVGVFGIVSIPLVATYLYDSILQRKLYITELLAKIFSPLFLIFVFAYIIVMMIGGHSPFVNREFLVIFNGLLILILGIIFFSIVTRSRDSKIYVADYVNVLLLSASILINLLALSAITFRLVEFGFTPNRFCVLGVNLIIFIHLIIIASAYVRVIMHQIDFDLLRKKVVNYLPVYSCWFVFVTYLLPLVFGFV